MAKQDDEKRLEIRKIIMWKLECLLCSASFDFLVSRENTRPAVTSICINFLANKGSDLVWTRLAASCPDCVFTQEETSAAALN